MVRLPHNRHSLIWLPLAGVWCIFASSPHYLSYRCPEPFSFPLIDCTSLSAWLHSSPFSEMTIDELFFPQRLPRFSPPSLLDSPDPRTQTFFFWRGLSFLLPRVSSSMAAFPLIVFHVLLGLSFLWLWCPWADI